MKTKPKPPVKLPKAQPIPSTMYAAYDARPGRGKIALVRYNKKLALGSVSSSFGITPVAVLPCRTRQEARGIVRHRRMSRDQMIEAGIKAVEWRSLGTRAGRKEYVEAILQALYLIP